MSTDRFVSLSSVGGLAVLTAVVAIWSISSSPRVADVQVQQAAANLAAATSFVVTLDQTESVIGTSEQIHVHEVVDYQAPDRQSSVETVVEDLAEGPVKSVTTFTQIGSSCWIHSSVQTAQIACERTRIDQLLGPVKNLEKVSGVTETRGTYVLSQKDSDTAISSEVAGQFTFGMAKVEARITGEFISWENVSLDAAIQGASIMIDEVITFTHVDDAPPVVAPPGPPTATATS